MKIIIKYKLTIIGLECLGYGEFKILAHVSFSVRNLILIYKHLQFVKMIQEKIQDSILDLFFRLFLRIVILGINILTTEQLLVRIFS